MADDAPEPDRVPGVPHPRLTIATWGQAAAEAAFLSDLAGDRLHHAWLLTGPRGVGKATLAWRIARFLLSTPPTGGLLSSPPESLDVPPDHPVLARMRALSEPRLFLMRPTPHPETGTQRRDITIDRARALKSFLQLTPPDGGHRVAIIDSADLLNVQAANALLKLLEEPPAHTVLLLIAHAPARLLPTIRSRCRVLRCAPLDTADMGAALTQAGLDPGTDALALAQLSGGSVGEAARLLQSNGPAIYADLIALFGPPQFDRARLLKLAGSVGGPANTARYDTTIRLIALFLARLARHGAGVPPDAEAARGEAAVLKRLAPDPTMGRVWADLQASVADRLARGRAVNLDPSALILDTGLAIHEAARALPVRA